LLFEANKVKVSESTKNFFYYSSLFVLIALAGLRYKVGGDSFAYLLDFEKIPFLDFNYNFSKTTYEPLWSLLLSFCKSVVNNFVFFQIVHAIFINSVVFWFIKKYTPYRFTAILFYYISLYLYFNTEILRESLAICCFLLAYPYFTKEKWIKYYLLAIVAIGFHYSALILLIAPIAKRFRFDARTFLWLFGVSVLFVAFSEQLEEFLLWILGKAGVAERYAIYQFFKLNIKGTIANYIILFFIPALVIYTNRKLNGQNNFKDLYFFYFFVVVAILVFEELLRFRNYMSIFCLVYWTNFIFNVFQWQFVRRLQKIVLCLLFVVFVTPDFVSYFRDTSKLVKGTKYYNRWYPYYSVFKPQEYPLREKLWKVSAGIEEWT
jgi:hypothetical protein